MVPKAAVVIPSRREARLAFALEALAVQSIGLEHFEVVVVRDPRSSGEKPVPPGLRVRWIAARSGSSPTAMRNLGWRESHAPLIAFTDDDCRPAPGWLERMLNAASGSATFLQGRTEPDPDELHLLHGIARSQRIEGPSDWFQCCNMAYPRALLERVGGFDERFTYGGEDTDLGLRAIAAGAERRYLDDALVWHAVISRPLSAAIRDVRPSESLVLRHHPDHRRALYARLFYRRSHAMLLLALAGALAARRRPLIGIGMTIPYLLANFEPSARTPQRVVRQLAGLGPRSLLDAAEILANTRAATRNRVLVI